MFDARTLKVIVVVVLLHAAVIYLLQSGLMRRAADHVLAPEIVAMIFKPEPPPEPSPPKPAKAPPEKRVVAPRPQPKPQPRPQPVIEPTPNLPPVETAIVVPMPPPEPPAPPAPAVVNLAPAAPKAVGIGQVQCVIPAPGYPAVSRRMGEQGSLSVRLTIGLSGDIEKALLVNGSGSDRLDRAAMDAAQRAHCKPYLEDGKAVRVTAVQPYVFKLDN